MFFKRTSRRQMNQTLLAWLLLAPTLFFMVLFTIWPIIRSVGLSFTAFELGMRTPQFIGLENYTYFATNALEKVSYFLSRSTEKLLYIFLCLRYLFYNCTTYKYIFNASA